MCAVPSHPMGPFPWDSHRNDIPMDKPGNTCLGCLQQVNWHSYHEPRKFIAVYMLCL